MTLKLYVRPHLNYTILLCNLYSYQACGNHSMPIIYSNDKNVILYRSSLVTIFQIELSVVTVK